MPNVVCVDDHELILEGLRTLIDQLDDFHWIGEYKHPDLLSQALEQNHTIDIILIDVFYHRENKLIDIGNLSMRHPQIKWIILSAYESLSLVHQAFSFGVVAYLRKDVTSQELQMAMQLAWSGKKNINFTGLDPKAFNPTDKPVEPLSAREKEIIALIIKGETEQIIAKSLFISKHTVHTHRKNIFKKLDLHSNAEVIRYFIENNLG